MTEGVDYSYARPSPSGLYSAGKRFAVRYLSYNTTGKNLTKAEADRLHAAGIATVSNWEWSAGDAWKGYTYGKKYAAEAAKQHTACGGPSDRPIYFSVDHDTRSSSAGEIDAIRGYFRGVREVLGKNRVGIYGGHHIVSLAAAGGWCDWFWQTYAWSYNSGLGYTQWYSGNHLEQYKNGVTVAGGDCDLDRAKQTDYGQWGVGGAGGGYNSPGGTDVELSDKLPSGTTVGGALDTLLVRTDYLNNRGGLRELLWYSDTMEPPAGHKTDANPFWAYVNGVRGAYEQAERAAKAAEAAVAQLGALQLPSDLTARLDAILAAASDDGDVTVQLPAEALALLTEIRDRVNVLPARP